MIRHNTLLVSILLTIACILAIACTGSTQSKSSENLALQWIERHTPQLQEFEFVQFGNLDTAYYSMEEYIEASKLRSKIRRLEKELSSDSLQLDLSRSFYEKVKRGVIKSKDKLDIEYAALDTSLTYSHLVKTRQKLDALEAELRHQISGKSDRGFKQNYVLKVRDENNHLVDTSIVFYFDEKIDAILAVDTTSVSNIIN